MTSWVFETIGKLKSFIQLESLHFHFNFCIKPTIILKETLLNIDIKEGKMFLNDNKTCYVLILKWIWFKLYFCINSFVVVLHYFSGFLLN